MVRNFRKVAGDERLHGVNDRPAYGSSEQLLPGSVHCCHYYIFLGPFYTAQTRYTKWEDSQRCRESSWRFVIVTLSMRRHIIDNSLQQMMGPEAMGVANANLTWQDEKVCRNFLCGTCPHTLFTNTVCTLLVSRSGSR